MAEWPTGTITFLYTDIEGSTRQWEQDSQAMRAAQARHDSLIRQAVTGHDGLIFRATGDGFCAAFATAPAALTAAVAAQRALRTEPWAETGPVAVRMAVHTGVAERSGDDYSGLALHRVARLLPAAHGGQILLTQAAYDLVMQDSLPPGVRLRDLGEHRLRDLSRPERVFQVLHPDLPAELPPLRTLDTVPNNLPTQLTSFVGRTREMAELVPLLSWAPSEQRLVTLTGPGGTGKTRLALQAAAGVLAHYPDGVWLVELGVVADAATVPHALAAAFGVRGEATRPLLPTLCDWLRPKQLLLVLDNCEHLVETCAAVVDDLLRAAPRVRILATSREPLGVSGESIWRVPPLTVPEDERALPAGDLQRVGAVQLFVERARLSLPTFALTERNAPAVAQICRRLDGIPLAIELAAARVRSLSLEQIAARLDDRFQLLAGGIRTAVPRQQTLRGAVDWSFQLLSDKERALFRRLAVFAGGRTLAAAEVVCTGGVVEREDVLDLLALLVDKSLVFVEEDAHQEDVRYWMLETIWQYGLEKLEESGEAALLRERHREWCLQLAERAAPELRGPQQAAFLNQLEAEHGNLRAALGRCRDAAGGTEQGLRLAGALLWFWQVRGHLSEGRDWLATFLGQGAPLVPARARALYAAGVLALHHDDYPAAQTLLTQSVETWQALGDRHGAAEATVELGHVAQAQRDLGTAHRLLERGLAVLRELGDEWSTAKTLAALGKVAQAQGDFATAAALYGDSLGLYRELGNPSGVAQALRALGDVAHYQGDLGAARAFYDESVGIARQIGDRTGIAHTLIGLAGLALDEGDCGTAGAVLAESLSVWHSLGCRGCGGTTLLRFAGLAAALGLRERALWLAGAGTSLRESTGTPLGPAEQAMLDRWLAPARHALDASQQATAWQEGRQVTWEQAIAVALEPSSFVALPDSGEATAPAPPRPSGLQAPERREQAPTDSAAGSALGPSPGPGAKAPSSPLTQRELEVAALVTEGLTNRQIAERLTITEGTARIHVAHVIAKLGMRSRAQVAAWVVEHRRLVEA